jgi:hypothetical protein
LTVLPLTSVGRVSALSAIFSGKDNQDMDGLTAFGLAAVSAMLLFYALEDRSPSYVLAFAGACAFASAYGFMQGAWPFGVVEAIWAAVAVQRWRKRVNTN